MKKLIYALLAIGLLACNSGPKSTDTAASNKSAHTPPANMMSINGILEADARNMVRDYIGDQTSSDPHTSFWFSKEMIDAALNTASTSGHTVDGIRFHLGKKAGKNSLILLLTAKAGAGIHQEFFSPASTVLDPTVIKISDEYNQPKGADLYTTSCANGPCTTTNSNAVDCKTARQWALNFVNGHGSQGMQIGTKSVWYPIGLFDKIKRDIADGTTGTKKGDGFRIYLVKKGDGKVTFILVPTYELTGGYHQDDYTCYATKKLWDPYDHGEECPAFCDGIILP